MLSIGKPFLAFNFKAMNLWPSPISRAILIRSSRVKISTIVAMIHVDFLGRSQNADAFSPHSDTATPKEYNYIYHTVHFECVNTLRFGKETTSSNRVLLLKMSI